MASVVCKLTPPRKGSEMSQLSPKAFLTSEKAMSPLKRKVQLPQFSPKHLKRIRLDPEPISEDSTITAYSERTQALLPNDREKLNVCIPFEWEVLQIRELKEACDKKDAELAGLRQLQVQRLGMYAANALITLARRLAKTYKPELLKDASTTRLQQFSANISDDQLKAEKVPTKFWPLLRKLDKYIEARNEQAHETERVFAQLLMSNQFKGSEIFALWKDIFPVLCGADVDVIAAQWQEGYDKLLRGDVN